MYNQQTLPKVYIDNCSDKNMPRFEEIIPNPYNISKPARSRSMFFGRKDIIDYVVNHVNKKGSNNILVLHGERRIGKTSILLQLKDNFLSQKHIPVYIDMHAITCKGTDIFFYNLSRCILNSLEKENLVMDKLCLEEFRKAPAANFNRKILNPIEEKLEDRKLVLMFDEIEELYNLVKDRKIDEKTLYFLRDTIQERKKICFIFTGAHQLTEIKGQYWSTLLNMTVHKRVDTLSKNDTMDLIMKPVEKYDMRYQESAKEYIFQISGGHPYFAQLVCYEMVEYHNKTQKSYLKIHDINNALDRICEKGNYPLQFIWEQSEKNERIILAALAEIENLSKPLMNESLLVLMRRYLPHYTLGELLDTLGKLSQRRILVKERDKDLYRFKVELVRMWIIRNQKLHEIIEEVG